MGAKENLHLIGKGSARAVCTFQNLPIVPVTGPVMQLAGKADGSPIHAGTSRYYLASIVDLGIAGRKGFQYWPDLRRMDAPHTHVTQLSAGLAGGSLHGAHIGKFGHDAV